MEAKSIYVITAMNEMSGKLYLSVADLLPLFFSARESLSYTSI